MPLRLKSLILHGYKTFAFKTTFEFSSGVTAIVGPNGSGKSNIADALRWVLGEQSYSLLRGKKTEDMIFSGSQSRPRSGMASASILFENSDNWLPVDFSEVELSRMAYRDGRNDYLINSQHVRLKDINELLAQSGLSERTYTILGQGLVDASLALKADERRQLFEEAAGIGLFRMRKEEALRRLDSCQRNLERVMDILSELGPRMKSLEKQAKKSQEYFQVQQDLRSSLRDWYGYHWHLAQKELSLARELEKAHGEILNQYRSNYEKAQQDYKDFRDGLQNIRANLNSWHRESARLHSERESISKESAVTDERIRSALENKRISNEELGKLQDELQQALDRLNDSNTELNLVLKDVEETKLQSLNFQEKFNQVSNDSAKIENELANLRSSQQQLEKSRIQIMTKQEGLSGQMGEKEEKVGFLSGQMRIDDRIVVESTAKFENWSKSVQEKETQIRSFERGILELENSHQNLANEQGIVLQKISAIEADLARLSAQNEVLEKADSELLGFEDGPKLILEETSKNHLDLKVQAISNQLAMPIKLETAIAAALGEFIDSIVVNSDQDVEGVFSILEKNPTGRVTFLPAGKLKLGEPLQVLNDKEFVGIAADLVTVKPELRVVANYLLGRVVVVTDKKAAARLIKKVDRDVRIVTLSGEIFFASGPIQAGQRVKTGIIQRTRQKNELSKEINKQIRLLEKLNLQKSDVEKKLVTILNKIKDQKTTLAKESAELAEIVSAEKEARDSVDSARRVRDWNISQSKILSSEIEQMKLEVKQLADSLLDVDDRINQSSKSIGRLEGLLKEINLDEYKDQSVYWNAQTLVANNRLEGIRLRNSEVQHAVDQINGLIHKTVTRISDLDTTIQTLEIKKAENQGKESQLNAALDELKNLIGPAETSLKQKELEEAPVLNEETRNQQVLAAADRHHNQLLLDLNRKQEVVENLRRKIEDDFGLVLFEYESHVEGPVPLPLGELVEKLPVLELISPDLEESISRQRMLMRRIGPINPEAQTEYDSVSERFLFLESQMEDLHKAEADIRQVIAELDEITEQEFYKTFQAVADEFKSIFFRLFAGGSARLILTDPENLIDSGIDIEARLPGKREQGLALLSGGERSLTAIALIFALLKVSPTPVCVLDEVDAMLDEANVGRFRDLLRELSHQTQFIIITHNRNTVQAAEVIYGVTMGKDSVSQVISLKLDEVSETYLRGKGD